MKDLCVFDLDGTLIPHDSFAELIKAHLIRNPALLTDAMLRRLRLIDRAAFAARAHRRLGPILSSQQTIDAICLRLQAAVVTERLALQRSWQEKGATTVLLSASPIDYVEPLGRMLGFDHAIGSSFVGTKYRHLHGEAKRHFIDETFPVETWRRTFAIADQPSDEYLLSSFEQVQRV